MKIINIFLIILVVFLSASCNNDNPPGPTNEPPNGYLLMECSSSNANFLDTANAYLSNTNNEIRIHSSSHLDQPVFSRLRIVCKGVTPGTYTAINGSESHVEFTDTNGIVYTSQKSPASVTIIINSIDYNNWKLSGTITGSLYELNGNKKIDIYNGKFNKIPIWQHN